MAALMIAILMIEEQGGKQLYGLANSRDQAGLMFRAAKAMVENDPELKEFLEVIPSQKRIVNHQNNSFYCALPAEATNADGFDSYTFVYDEIHEAKSRDLWDKMKTSTGTQEEPLQIAITTAGYDRETICWELHDYAVKVRDGIIDNPSFLPILYYAEEEDDWLDEDVWHKANPALGDFRKLDEMRTSMAEAVDMPAKENSMRRLYLNQWTNADKLWFSTLVWEKCQTEWDVEELKGKKCFFGGDLSCTIDLTSLAFYFPYDGHKIYTMSYLAEDRLMEAEKRDNAPYSTWMRQGFIRTTPGNVIDYEYIRKDISKFYQMFNVLDGAMDKHNATGLLTALSNDNIEISPMGQGWLSMNSPCKELQRLVISGALDHGGNPLLAWAASNTVAKEDPAGNLKPDKSASTKRIDPIVATINAIAVSLIAGGPKESVYEDGGVFTF